MKRLRWVIPCPSCQQILKVEDHSLLGRRGQCPNCGHKFQLELPKSSEFETKPRREVDLDTEPPDDTQKPDPSTEKPRWSKH